MSENISHNGRIERIENGKIFVRITQRSACSLCHAKGMCSAADSKEKIIEVSDTDPNRFQVGEEVTLCGESSLALQAVLLAFVLPMAVVIMAVAAGSSLEWSEEATGLMGLLLLVPYYGILYFFRERLKRKFIFTLKKLN